MTNILIKSDSNNPFVGFFLKWNEFDQFDGQIAISTLSLILLYLNYQFIENHVCAACHRKLRTQPVWEYIEVYGVDVCQVAYAPASAKDKTFMKVHDFVEFGHRDGKT